MTEAAIIQHIADTFEGVKIVTAAGDTFFIYDPNRNLPPNQQTPFVTIVTSDAHDAVSSLNRPGVFRLNVGVSKPTFQSHFGPPPPLAEGATGFDSGAAGVFDFAALDTLLPHPVYGRMNWLCVLNPSDATFEILRPLIDEAYDIVFKRRSAARA